MQNSSKLILSISPDDLANGSEQTVIAALQNASSWSEIPLLNYTPLDQLKDLSIVRFRGMIQDIRDPEFYLKQYLLMTPDGGKRIQSGKYRDCLVLKPNEKVDFDAVETTQGDRRSFHVVSIPGMNTWSENYERECNKRTTPNTDAIADSEHEQSSSIDNGNAKKRAAVADDVMEVDINTDVNHTLNEGNESKTKKRQCVGSETSTTATDSGVAAEYMINSPIPDRPSKACLVKMYTDLESYSLNTVIDVVGFLSVDPSLCLSNAAVNTDICPDRDELLALNPPPSLIPRLHAIAVHKLTHYNPLIDVRLLPADGASHVANNINMLNVQKDLHKLLSLILFNDDLAAEYLLSHLLSTIYTRNEMQSIGKFALNLCNVPAKIKSTYSKHLYTILEQLLPASHYIPMCLDTLNDAAFTPIKDYQTGILVSGLLQLAPHTHLVLDETQLQQGKLEMNGIESLKHLAFLINQQQIKVNFKFFDLDYNVDIPVLVLSEGKSLLPHDMLLPLQADSDAVSLMEETFKAAQHFLNEQRLHDFRRFLTMGKIDEFTMHSEDPEMVQNDFVEMRRMNPNCNADDLHRLLVLSRLLGIARGKAVLDKECWELAKQCEIERRKRIDALPKSSLNLLNN